MRLADSIAEYADTEARILASFCRYLGNGPMMSITADRVRAFLDGVTPISSYWQRKHTALAGLFRFAVARGYGVYAELGIEPSRLGHIHRVQTTA